MSRVRSGLGVALSVFAAFCFMAVPDFAHPWHRGARIDANESSVIATL